MGMRFLLLCAEESLCIYTVPDYDQLARVETKHPILSSHIVSLNGKAAASSNTPPLRQRASSRSLDIHCARRGVLSGVLHGEQRPDGLLADGPHAAHGDHPRPILAQHQVRCWCPAWVTAYVSCAVV